MNNSIRSRYIIIGYARSGTTVTHLALMGHPNVAALNDEMQIEPFFSKGISTFTFGNDMKEEKEKGYTTLFNALSLLRADENTCAHGIKIVCNSPKRAKILIDVLQNYLKDIKIILIIRKDLVAQYGSAQSGVKSGIMHSWYEGFENRHTAKIKINKWRFTAYVLNVFRVYDELLELKKTHDLLEIYYEDIQTSYGKMFEFLNVQPMEPKWLRSKKVMPPPNEYIINYTRMKQLLDKLEELHRVNAIPVATIYKAKIVARLYRMFKKLTSIKIGRKILSPHKKYH